MDRPPASSIETPRQTRPKPEGEQETGNSGSGCRDGRRAEGGRRRELSRGVDRRREREQAR